MLCDQSMQSDHTNDQGRTPRYVAGFLDFGIVIRSASAFELRYPFQDHVVNLAQYLIIDMVWGTSCPDSL